MARSSLFLACSDFGTITFAAKFVLSSPLKTFWLQKEAPFAVKLRMRGSPNHFLIAVAKAVAWPLIKPVADGEFKRWPYEIKQR